MRATLRVLVVDDHRVVRAGTRRILENEGVEVVGEAATAEDALALLEESATDIVLADVRLPGMSGIDLAGAVRKRWPEVKVLILSSFANGGYARAALDAGAVGYLVKTASDEELLAALHSAALGATVLDPAVSAELLSPGAAGVTNLTDRERQVVELVVQGLPNKAVAADLGRSVGQRLEPKGVGQPARRIDGDHAGPSAPPGGLEGEGGRDRGLSHPAGAAAHHHGALGGQRAEQPRSVPAPVGRGRRGAVVQARGVAEPRQVGGGRAPAARAELRQQRAPGVRGVAPAGKEHDAGAVPGDLERPGAMAGGAPFRSPCARAVPLESTFVRRGPSAPRDVGLPRALLVPVLAVGKRNMGEAPLARLGRLRPRSLV